jgi:predicted ATPase/DNA-binding CsgD family transcriptional regulator
VIEPTRAGSLSADLALGSAGWREWLEHTNQTSFRYSGPQGSFSGRREVARGRSYWYAYRKQNGRLRKAYLGLSHDLTLLRLQAVAAQLTQMAATAVGPSMRLVESLQARPGPESRLPIPPTPLIGRADDIELARNRLLQAGVHLLTLVGPGGTGKTRLAIAVAETVRDEFADGVWFIDLSATVDASLVLREIARHLGVHDDNDRPVRERLHQHLAGRNALLVLDNVEQVLSGAPELAGLVAACPGVKLLVTSREPLHLHVESQFSVSPLALPDLAHLPARRILERVPAVELFLQRAQAAGANLELNDSTARDIATVCVRLDGLPLAIELAAARAKLFSPRAMLSQLDRQLDLLRVAEHDRAARHKSLRAAAAWSYDLLTDSERGAFNGLSVFAGGCTLEAAEDVLSSVGILDALDQLAALVDKSLIRSEVGRGGETRLRMLQTIRAYGLEQLAASGDESTVRRLHAMHYLGRVKPASWDVLDLPTPEFVAEVGGEYDNVRAALRFAVDAGDANAAVELALSIQGFWLYAGYLNEGREWIREALAHPLDAPPLVLAMVEQAAGQLAWRQGDYAAATAHYEASVRLRRQIGDPVGVAIAVQGLASIARDRGETQRAIQLWEECLAAFRAAGNRPRIARAALNLAISLHLAGESERAAGLLDETVALAREVHQDWAEASALTYRALIALVIERDAPRSAGYVCDALGLLERVPDAWVIAHLVELSAFLAAEHGEDRVATQLLAAGEAVRTRMSARLHPAFQDAHLRYESKLQAALEAAFDAARNEGRALADDALRKLCVRAVAGAAASARRVPTQVRLDALSEREREVALLIAQGLTNREIGAALIISERTVETHVDHLRSKLGVRSRAQIAAWTVERGIAART